MTIRDKRQEEFAEEWFQKGKFGILHLCPRFGKIKTTINILQKLNKEISVLIAYPDKKIKESWENDLQRWGYMNPNIVYTTHMSLKKHVDKIYDVIVIDEVHALSPAQITICEKLFEKNRQVIALTGTMSSWTQRVLREDLKLHVLSRYSIEKAIEEGVLPDYEINIVSVPLDNTKKTLIKSKFVTEKERFDKLSKAIDFLEMTGGNNKFMRLERMRIIQASYAKSEATRSLIDEFSSERILIFCGLIVIAEDLGVNSYHSKSSEKQMFRDFVEGKTNHLAVVRIGSMGSTYTPLSKVIINYFDSNSENLTQKINRCMSFEYDNPDKKAIIYIVTSTEDVEKKWLTKSLAFFDKNKIKYL